VPTCHVSHRACSARPGALRCPCHPSCRWTYAYVLIAPTRALQLAALALTFKKAVLWTYDEPSWEWEEFHTDPSVAPFLKELVKIPGVQPTDVRRMAAAVDDIESRATKVGPVMPSISLGAAIDPTPPYDHG